MSVDPIDLSPRIPHQILTSLLNKPRYKAKWMPYVQRRRGATINQRAVAAFIAGELSNDLDQEISPQKLKDRVARALKGEAISDTTAQLFISAFGFSPQETREFQRALSTHNMNLRVAQRSTYHVAKGTSSQNHQYVSLSTYLDGRVNEFGYLYEATITEVIQAEDEQVNAILPRFESVALRCTMLEGGELAEVRPLPSHKPHNARNSVHQLVIKPSQPIRKGEIHQLRYRLDLDVLRMIKSPDTDNSIVFGPFSSTRFNFSLRLQFDRSPTNMKQKFWNRVMNDDALLETHDLPSRDTYSVYFPLIEDTICAFYWDCQVDEALAYFGIEATS